MKRLPEKNDNSWLGNTCNYAYCYDKKGNAIFKTLDAPNPVAYAVQQNKNITKVVGLLGQYDMNEMKKRPLDKSSFANFQNYLKTV